MVIQFLLPYLTWSSIHSSSAPSMGSVNLAYMTLTVSSTSPGIDMWGCSTQLQSCIPLKDSGKPSFAINPLEVTLVEVSQRSWWFIWTTEERWLWCQMCIELCISWTHHMRSMCLTLSKVFCEEFKFFSISINSAEISKTHMIMNITKLRIEPLSSVFRNRMTWL